MRMSIPVTHGKDLSLLESFFSQADIRDNYQSK